MATTHTDTVAAIRIDVDGTITRVRLEASEDASTLQALYRQTGAQWVECFPARGGDKSTQVNAWMDEEGRMNGSLPNAHASAVITCLLGELPVITTAGFRALTSRHPSLLHYGNILLTGGADHRSDITDVPADVADIITAIGFTIS